jgi:hypothetical protein
MATTRRANANKASRGSYTRGIKANNALVVNTRVQHGTRGNGYFTTASGAVPESTFNTGGIRTTGVVAPNDGTNTIAVRQRVAEQNFIRRLSVDIQNAIIKENPQPINLTMYADALKESKIDEEEAITIYNELIGLFIMHILYLNLILKNINSGGSYSSKTAKSPDFLRKSFDAEKLRINMANGLLIGGGIIGAATAAATVAALSFSVVGIPFIPVLATGTSLVSTAGAGGYLTRLFSTNVVQARIAKGQALTLSLSDVIALIHSTMFLPENKIPISSVKDKLKYWGLSTSQVEYLFVQTPDTALQAYNKKRGEYMDARQLLFEKKDAFNVYNQNYTQQKLQELRSAPGYKRPMFRNNTMALTQLVQQAKASNDEYIQQKFVIDYNEAQQRLQAVLSSSGYKMRNGNLSNQLDATSAFVFLFSCLPPSSELAPNKPLGPKDPYNAAYPNESANPYKVSYPLNAPVNSATAAAPLLAATPPLNAPGGPAATAAVAANAAANAAAVATAAAQQATAAANAAGAAPVNSVPMSEDENNKQTLIEINTSLTYLRKTLRQRGVKSLRNYMATTLKIRDKAPLLFRLFECLKSKGGNA